MDTGVEEIVKIINVEKQMKLIGIIGYKREGKDTTAEAIQFSSKDSSEIVHFADKLKQIATDLGWNGKKDKKGRKVLQYLGTEVARNISDTYWIDRLNEQIKNTNEECFIIPDVRYLNEAEYILKNGGKLIVVERKPNSLWGRIKRFVSKRSFWNHKSEKWHKWIKKVPYIKIDNSGTIKELDKKIENCGILEWINGL